MRLSGLLFGIILSLSLTQCKKDVQTTDCMNEIQKNDLLHTLESLSHDTTQISAPERQFINEIRAIANDVSSLSSDIDTTISIHASYDQIRTNFLQHVDLVTQKATLFYGNSEPKIILAKNAFVLMSYDALQRNYPEFMWTQLGVFAANEVRSGLVLALSMRYILMKNNIHIAFNNVEIADAMLESSEILIQGQIDVLTDIGSLVILNRKVGADKIKNETWLTTEAKEGFRLQEQAENILKTGDCNKFMDLQTAAAIQFGAHEQIYILQPMWDKPLMQQFADLDKLLIQLTNQKFVFFGDIFIGTNKTTEANKGYNIKLPSTVNNLANAQQRVTVAMNGFNTLNTLRKNPEWSKWIDYSQVKIGYGYDVYNGVVE